MALKAVPHDYIPFDDDLLMDFLLKKYGQENGSFNITNDELEEQNDILDYYGFPETTAATNIIIYIAPFLLFFSTVGNILSLIILCRLCYEVWSSCVYLAIMSVLDLFMLYTWCGNEWLVKVAYIHLSNELLMSSVSVCKVYTFLFSAVIHMHKWLMVCLSVDLFIATKYPQKVPQMCTLSRAKAIILLLTVVLACINIHFFWTYEIVNLNTKAFAATINSEDTYMCTFVQQGVPHSELFEYIIWPIIDILVAQLIPFILIATFTVLTIVQFCKGKGMMDCKEEKWRKKYLLYPHAMKQLKLSVLVICILYTLTIPRLVMTMYRKGLEAKNIELGFHEKAKMDLADAIFSYLDYTFLSIKFYILFISCRQFRAEFYNICGRICKYHKKSNHYNNKREAVPGHMSFWQNSFIMFRQFCGYNNTNRKHVPEVSSKHFLMGSNPSSTEFHIETGMHTNHMYNHMSSQIENTDVEHTIV